VRVATTCLAVTSHALIHQPVLLKPILEQMLALVFARACESNASIRAGASEVMPYPLVLEEKSHTRVSHAHNPRSAKLKDPRHVFPSLSARVVSLAWRGSDNLEKKMTPSL
jgi:hypothetical protein